MAEDRKHKITTNKKPEKHLILMDAEEKTGKKQIQERKEKIKNWLKDKDNLALLIVLFIAFGIRLYYFFITQNQALWWDEAEYLLKANSIAFGTADTSWWMGRPILFPFIAAIFFKIGLGEWSLRLIWAIMSFSNVVLIYLIGKNLFNKRVGIISSFLYTFFYLDLFYASRMLVDLPQIFFVLLATHFFISGYILKKNPKRVYFIAPLLVAGILLRFTVGIFFIILILFLLISEGFKFLKEKSLWFSLLLGFILYLPYWIWSYLKFKSLNPFYVIFYTLGSSVEGRMDTPLGIFMTYVNYFPSYFGGNSAGILNKILIAIFILSFIYLLFKIAISFDYMRKSKIIQNNILLLLWILIPMVYFGFFVNHFEDRYLFMSIPASFILIGWGFDIIIDLFKKYSKNLSFLILIIILLISIYPMMQYSNYIIKDKVQSYSDLKNAGDWMQKNLPSGNVLTAAAPEITYYTRMPSYSHENNLTLDLEKLNNNTFDYVVISNWERTPQYFFEYFSSNQSRFSLLYQSNSVYHSQEFFAVVLKVKNTS